MELEEMKTLWNAMSDRVERVEVLNRQNIMEMTQLKYSNKFNKLRLYESTGAVVCSIFALAILFNIGKLDAWYLMACGIFCILFLVLMPIISLRSINSISKINLNNYSYKDVLIRFEKEKQKTLHIQRIGIVFGILFMFATIPVSDRILNGNDIFKSEVAPSVWFALAFASVFVIFAYRWGYGWYKKVTSSAENILKDLED